MLMLKIIVSLLDMELSFDVNRGTTVLPYDAGAVAVIDGSKSIIVRVAFRGSVSLTSNREFEAECVETIESAATNVWS